MKVVYNNRYRVPITFERTGKKRVKMSNYGEWYRCGWPNVYDKAYEAYIEDCAKTYPEKVLSWEEFKKEVLNYENKEIFAYAKLIYSDEKTINMFDPSGGPYLYSGLDLDTFFKSGEPLIIKKFVVKKGYTMIHLR